MLIGIKIQLPREEAFRAEDSVMDSCRNRAIVRAKFGQLSGLLGVSVLTLSTLVTPASTGRITRYWPTNLHVMADTLSTLVLTADGFR